MKKCSENCSQQNNVTVEHLRRTTSLDALSPWNSSLDIILLDKATQTEWSPIEGLENIENTTSSESPVIREHLENSQTSETVSIQTVQSKPIHGFPSSTLMPVKPGTNIHIRHMRSSVEGLNQEIEKLVLYTGQKNSSQNELCPIAGGTPEGHRAPVAELFHDSMRSVNTQTPMGDIISSDESPSSDDRSNTPSASPRINRFLSREPPDGCERISTKIVEKVKAGDFKPNVGSLVISQASAFTPLQQLNTEKIISEQTE
ncbi:protein FAM117B-like [Condylostylus longicornis]|uniref:protein FAM117B-like n=1 Tax=Condylostylus longicornis TaxID=2530218 RepID=UPI00244DB28F|nr:protein FAM117B-like [Condylostylus longicornis]